MDEPVDSLAALASAGLVIEAIIENLDIKVDVLRQVEEMTSPQTILATNTSSLSVTALSSRLRRPGRVVGMHFFNPAPLMPLVEVISGRLTEAAVAQTIFATAQGWGNTGALHFFAGFHRQPRGPAFLWRGIAPSSERAASPATLDASYGRPADFGWVHSRSWI